MKPAIHFLTIALFCSCSQPKPANVASKLSSFVSPMPPPIPTTITKKVSAPQLQPAAIKPPQIWVLPFYYDTNIIQTNFWWELQSSSNLIQWKVECEVLDYTGLTNYPIHDTNKFMFYRTHGYQ